MPLSIRLTEDREARLEAPAAGSGPSSTFCVRQAMEAHRDELEGRHWADPAVREWESSERRSRPADQLWGELGRLSRWRLEAVRLAMAAAGRGRLSVTSGGGWR